MTLTDAFDRENRTRENVARPSTPRATSDDSHARRYALAALAKETAEVSTTAEGTRNARLNTAAYSLGQLVGSGALSDSEVWGALRDAARAAGLGASETEATIASGLGAGQKEPRVIPEPEPRRNVPTHDDLPPDPMGDAWKDEPTCVGLEPTSNVTNISAAKKRGKKAGAPRPPRKPHAEVDGGGQRMITGEPWEKYYTRNQYGVVKGTLANVLLCLSQHEAWRRVIAHDAFAEAVITTRQPAMRDVDAPTLFEPGEWTSEDTSRFCSWFARGGDEPKPGVVDAAVQVVARRNVVHPVRDYLSGLAWDGLPRLDRMLHTYFGAADSEYTRAVSSKWMLSAVARIFQAGCQADCMLILEGLQGIRKSTGLETLCPDPSWFSDTIPSLGEKDSYQCLRRKWLIEVPELDAMRGREITATKRFVSGRTDNYRPSYGRRNRDFPRQCVFCGTTNESNYLPDKTGNRRFWPVRCGVVLVENIRADRDQLWAEAVHRYRAGERWFLDTPELRRLAEHEQAQREQVDDWLTPVQRWLKAPTRPTGADTREPVDLDQGVTTYDVLTGALGMASDRIEHRHTIRAGNVLRDLGFEPINNSRPRTYRRAEPHE